MALWGRAGLRHDCSSLGLLLHAISSLASSLWSTTTHSMVSARNFRCLARLGVHTMRRGRADGNSLDGDLAHCARGDLFAHCTSLGLAHAE